ncbi:MULTISPECIES: hypothetical protein [unclassified Roseovarius]|uniref:hypothetical protein n=1 Tax=unclassified Roseovarius TaxID=2614913 RepID=UPI00273DAD9B|nr:MULTISPECIES: hypothetical protein [unclassified Roseovarius]
MNTSLTRRLEKLEGLHGKDGPAWPDIVFLVSLMPDGAEHSGEAEEGPFVAFVKGGPFHGIGSEEGETLDDFRRRLQAEYPHLSASQADHRIQNSKGE